jgi:hypothetical protein
MGREAGYSHGGRVGGARFSKWPAALGDALPVDRRGGRRGRGREAEREAALLPCLLVRRRRGSEDGEMMGSGAWQVALVFLAMQGSAGRSRRRIWWGQGIATGRTRGRTRWEASARCCQLSRVAWLPLQGCKHQPPCQPFSFSLGNSSCQITIFDKYDYLTKLRSHLSTS